MQETRVWPLNGEDPLEKGTATHSSILALELHGQKSLVGYSPWSQKEVDMTERLTLSLSLDSPASSPHCEILDLTTPTESPYEVKSTGSRG